MTLGECINNYINEHDGMSMRKFATLANVSHAYISNIVNGKTSRGNNPVPSIDVYRGIAKAMGIDVNTLISMVDDKIAWGEQKNPATESDGVEESYESAVLNASERERNIILRILQMSPEQQEAFLTLTQSAPSSQLTQDDKEQKQ